MTRALRIIENRFEDRVANALLVAASFTAGWAAIHALRGRADGVTLVLGIVAYGLTTALCSLAAGRNGVFVLHDPVHTSGILIVADP